MKEVLEYEWTDTGKLTVEVEGNYSAKARYFPSKAAIIEAVNKHDFCHSKPSILQALNSTPDTEKSILGLFSEFQGDSNGE